MDAGIVNAIRQHLASIPATTRKDGRQVREEHLPLGDGTWVRVTTNIGCIERNVEAPKPTAPAVAPKRRKGQARTSSELLASANGERPVAPQAPSAPTQGEDVTARMARLEGMLSALVTSLGGK